MRTEITLGSHFRAVLSVVIRRRRWRGQRTENAHVGFESSFASRLCLLLLRARRRSAAEQRSGRRFFAALRGRLFVISQIVISRLPAPLGELP